jgi:multimeric flavodoxin WrbA
MRQILAYETIIFITPVYWYSMSGLMKNFFDRISDCLKTEKDLGRKLRGKNMIAIACGSDETEVEGFFVPFKNSAEYLGMNYLGNLHTWVEHKIPGEVVLERIELFTNETKKRLANNQS